MNAVDHGLARRRWGLFLGASGVLILAVFAAVAAAATPLVASRFNVNGEGWLVAGDATSATPTYVAGGGNPGGYLSSTDSAVGGVTYWVAPAKFRGNKSAAYDGFLTFDLRQSATDTQFDTNDVVIAGDGLTLAHDTAVNPAAAPAWTNYRVRLRASQFADVTSGTPEPATKRDVQRVLGSITSLQIRAEYRTGPDTDDLDNVRLLPPPA